VARRLGADGIVGLPSALPLAQALIVVTAH
jgi:hypothetical protein